MSEQTADIQQLTDEQLALLLRDAQAERARRDSGRMSLSEIRRCFSDAARQLNGGIEPSSDFAAVDKRLANLGVRMIVVDGRLYLEKVGSE